MLRFLLLTLLVSGAQSAACPVGWLAFSDFCYFFSDTAFDFQTGRDICKSRNAESVTINSPEERRFLDGVVATKRTQFWMGMRRDPDNRDVFNWVDNSSPGPLDPDIVNWDNNQPDDSADYDCVHMKYDGRWATQPCGWTKAYMCKRSNSVHDVCDIEGNWHLYDDQCFKYFEQLRDWDDSRSQCQAEGGDLAVLDTQSKWRVLSEVIDCTDYQNGIWIGLSDKEQPGSYQWVDGTSLSTANWDDNMPPTSGATDGDNCVHSFPLNNYKWRSARCGDENHFTCMRPKSSCYPGWLDYDSGSCYMIFGGDPSNKLGWSDAERYCNEVGQGGRLMKITNQDQQDALAFMAAQLAEAGVSRVRIGLSDKFRDNVFEWSDGTSVVFSNWGSQSGVDDRWDCAYVSTNDVDAKWNTDYCFSPEAFICQLPAFADAQPVTPPPETWQCDEGWVVDQRKGDCYLLSSDEDKVDYGEAMSRCMAQSATLLTIRDENDQAFVTDIARFTTFLGLEYNSGNQRYEWYDNTPMTFMNWDSQSDPNTNQVARMSLSPNVGSWVSESRSTPNNFICRKKAESTTATPTDPVPTPPWSSRCGPGWAYDNLGRSCYQIIPLAMTWEAARATCQGLDEGSDLASITGSNDQNFINALVATSTVGGAPIFWTGGNDIDQSSGWKWTDGSPFAYLNWYDGEPNDWTGNEWCIELTGGERGGRWFDHDCATLYKSICKKPASDREPPPTPDPTPPPPECTDPEPLISGTHYIQDSSFYATTSQSGREASRARLDSTASAGGGGWSPESSDDPAHISVNFHTPVHALKIVTQGADDRDQWITKYRIDYRLASSDSPKWITDDNGDIVEFDGNTDRNSKVENDLTSQGLLVTRIRIYPLEANGDGAMRLEIMGCRWGTCPGEEHSVSGESMVPDERMTASGSWDEFHGPERARIYSVKEGTYRGGWVADYPWTDQQWIQVEFDVHMTVTAIHTLGREDYPQYCGSYKLLFSDDGTTWENYQEPYGTDKVFPGNVDQHTLVVNELYAPMRSKFVRINPQSWTNGVGLRMEIAACHSRDCAANALITGVNHRLDDNRLSASSMLDANHGPSRSRLHQQPSGDQAGGWVPEFQNNQQWIQVDLGYEIEIVGVATQGQHGFPNFITQYYVSHSRNLERWYNHSDTGDGIITMYDGNLDQTRARKHYFTRQFRARAVRVHPVAWNNSIGLRWEVYGCPGIGSQRNIGCFGDVIADRDLPYLPIMSTPGGMTRSFCSLHCFNNDYSYAGIQYGRECFCGNSYGKYGLSNDCTMPCFGDPSDTCGGLYANDITYTGISAMYDRCREGWIPFGNDCYQFFPTSTTWDDAEFRCKTLGPNTHLATINSPEEQDFINSQLAIYESRYWIGLHCKRYNNQFEWVNGDTVRYTNWNRREPNDAATNEDCVMIYPTGKWNDDPCDNRRSNPYICQQPKENLPFEPTPAPDPGCGENWVPYRWKCYTVIKTRANRGPALLNCQGLGGTLAKIEDGYEHSFLASLLNERGETGFFWTQIADDEEHLGYYTFLDGNPPPATFWAQDYPIPWDKRSCAAMYASDHGMWHNLNCPRHEHYICEKRHGLVSRPTGQPTVPAVGECATGWQSLGDNDCVQVNNPTSNFHRTWFDALSHCQGQGADLISIHNQDINNQAFVQIIGQSYGFWLGLNSLDGESYKWSDGSPFEYNNWNFPDEPGEDPDENCVEMLAGVEGKWATTSCNANKPWLCKIRRGASPTVTPTLPLPTAGPPGSCQPDSDDWKLFNGRCYFFSPLSPTEIRSNLDWWAAQLFCNQYGAHLVSIHSAEENDFVMGQVREVEDFNLWIGFNQLTPREGWNWIDQTPVNYRNWGEGQPDNEGGQEMCGSMAVAHNNMGFWNDKHCQNEYGFICVKNPGGEVITTPEPTVAPGNCPEDWLGFGSKCYKLYEDPVDWNTAVANCKAEVREPWSLATFDSIWEMYFMMSNLRQKSRVYWIGLHQIHGGDGEFGWVDNSKVVYTNWNSGEPNGGAAEGCVEMYTGPFNAGKWNDVACNGELPYICMQFKDPSLPELPPAPNPCISDDFVEFEGNCYKIASARDRTWQEAEDHCQEDENGHLASIHSLYEQAFVSYYYHQRDYKIWIGLTDQQEKGRYYWADGTAIRYTNWHPSQPDMTSPACVYMSHNDDALWFDEDCDTGMRAMCEIYSQPPVNTRPPSGLCPASSQTIDWVEFGSHCYYFSMDSPVTFGEAQTECNRLGGHLASVHSDEENDFIVTHTFSQTLHWVWLGLIRAQAGGWVWLDGTAYQYNNWNDGEPSPPEAGENCGELYPTVGDGKWNDVVCTLTNDYVCKVRMLTDPGVTVPSTSVPPGPSSGSNPTNQPGSSPGSTTVPNPGSPGASTTIPSISPPPGIGQGGGGMSAGQTAGVVFGVLISLLVVGFVGFVLYRRHQAAAASAGMGSFDNPTYASGGVTIGTKPGLSSA